MGLLAVVMKQLAIFRILNGSGNTPEDIAALERMQALPYNPMLNAIILREVFRHSSRSDLLRNREVCRAWNNLATILLRAEWTHRVVKHESDLKRLIQLTTSSPTTFPLNRFYIKIPHLDRSNALFKALSIRCIVSLKLVCESKHFPGAMRTIRSHMRALRHLVVSRIPEHSFEALCVATETEKTVSSSLPKLVSVSFRNANPSRNFLATFDSAVIEIVRSADSCLRVLEFSHWNSLARVFRECPLASVKCLRVGGGKLTETDILVLTSKRALRLDEFVARVDKSVRSEILDEFIRTRVG